MEEFKILAIDPGKETGIVIYQPPTILWSKVYDQNETLDYIRNLHHRFLFDRIGIEMIGHYGKGMPVGAEVFDTCIFIGRLLEIFETYISRPILIKRHEIKMHFCGSVRAKDANIRQALIDRFGPPGTKKAPGVLYGIKSHCWPALALAVFLADTKVKL